MDAAAGDPSGAVLVAEGSVWVANRGDGTISRVDPATNRVIATVDVGANPTRLTADAGAVWVATAQGLQRIEPATNRVVRILSVRVGPGDVLAADGRLWVSLVDGTVRRLDTTDGRVLASVSVAPKGVALMASGRGGLWAGYGHTVVAIDPRDAHVTARFGAVDQQGTLLPNQGPQLTGLVLVDGVVWRSSSDPPAGVIRFPVDPPTEAVQGEEVVVGETSGLAAGPTGVFRVSRTTQTLTRLDPSTGEAKARIRLPGLLQATVGADAVWATTDSRGMLYRIDPQATD